jgi:aspartyl-tRNA(Asn)/glutamyl-tRNA(Gln) amidotransferase subunit A
MKDKSLRELHDGIREGAFSSTEVASYFLGRVSSYSALNAFSECPEDLVLSQSKTFDDEQAGTKATGALAGVPVALKDNIVDTEFRTRCASKILGDFRSFVDASVVERLRGSGAIRFGKTNMDEFAMGSSGEHSAFGRTHNPWSPDVVPGGSSSGSAAAVAARLVPAALGSDTGGSIRQPAALCGVVGMKPTYGRISRRGLVAYGSSLDQIGPLTKTVEDAAILYSELAGFDSGDSTSADRPVEDVFESLHDGCEGLRVGLPREYFGTGLADEVRQTVEKVAEKLEDAGASVVEVSLPHTEYAVAAYYIIATAEASSNLSRFDGVRYGHRTEAPRDIHELYAKSRAEGFGDEVIRRILLGTFVLSSGYYDAYYRRAQQVRRLVRNDFEQAFETCDVLLTPTTPTPAFQFGRTGGDPVEMYMADVFTVPANLAGLPGISVPADLSKDRLPIGVQFLANSFDEPTLFRAGQAWESLRGPFAEPSLEPYADGGSTT